MSLYATIDALNLQNDALLQEIATATADMATQTWVTSQLTDMATMTWVTSQLGGYLPLTGGNLTGPLDIDSTADPSFRVHDGGTDRMVIDSAGVALIAFRPVDIANPGPRLTFTREAGSASVPLISLEEEGEVWAGGIEGSPIHIVTRTTGYGGGIGITPAVPGAIAYMSEAFAQGSIAYGARGNNAYFLASMRSEPGLTVWKLSSGFDGQTKIYVNDVTPATTALDIDVRGLKAAGTPIEILRLHNNTTNHFIMYNDGSVAMSPATVASFKSALGIP